MSWKILIVDDDPISSRLTEYALKKQGCEVLTAPNGLAGLRIVREKKPDLVVLDIMLPGIDGFEICSRLRAAGHNLPIVMCSGLGGEADRKTGLKLGASEYLVKPVSPTVVVSAVERLLASGAAKQQTEMLEHPHG